jgi:hypothetical protein
VFARRDRPVDFTVTGKVSGTPTPTAQRPDATGGAPAEGGFIASGAWTMSSLPGCFFEQSHRFGRLTELEPTFPPATQRMAAGSTIRWGACTVSVRPDQVWIARGDDRLRVPPVARLYRDGDRLVLVSIAGRQAEIRRYCRRYDAVRCPPQSFPHPHRM